MDATECVKCFHDTGFNRVIVRESTGDVLGGLCEACENAVLEHGVSDPVVEAGGCACCGSTGRFAVPLIDLLVESDDGLILKDVEYTIETATPRLCFNHFHQLTDEELSRLVTV